ncbi:MAG: hypothetical protein RLZZ84_991 [Pseudomonadota bacterium]|jgi:hypothetical protein
MRRSLVLTSEAATHPFRRLLPGLRLRGGAQARGRKRGRITAQDVKEFLLAYCACFLAVSLYLA